MDPNISATFGVGIQSDLSEHSQLEGLLQVLPEEFRSIIGKIGQYFYLAIPIIVVIPTPALELSRHTLQEDISMGLNGICHHLRQEDAIEEITCAEDKFMFKILIAQQCSQQEGGPGWVWPMRPVAGHSEFQGVEAISLWIPDPESKISVIQDPAPLAPRV